MDELDNFYRPLMRFIIGPHSKVPSEIMYLETSAIPLRHVILIRRMVYFQTLITREDGELTKKVYETQKINPSKGDWIEHLKEDFQFIDENIDEKVAKEMTKLQYKTIIKKKIRQKVFKNLMTV